MNNLPSLRRLSRDELAFGNLLAQRREPLRFEWLETTWQCTLMPAQAPRRELLDVELDWGGARAVFRVDAAWIDDVARRSVGGPLDPQAPELLVIAMLETALGDLADLIEDATRKRIRIVGTRREASRDGLHAWAWCMACEQREVLGELWVDPLGLGFLAGAWKSLPASAARNEFTYRDLPVPLRFAIGWTDIDMRQLRELCAGDILVPDECWLKDGSQLMLRAGDGHAFECTLNKTTLEVTEGPRPIMSDSLEFDDQDDDENEGGPGDASFDDLPVRLSFDLGERTVTLAELRGIGPGYSFDLGRELRRAVHIRANGKTVGEGELVEIDGRIGIAVVSLKGSLKGAKW